MVPPGMFENDVHAVHAETSGTCVVASGQPLLMLFDNLGKL